ncbi:hypothetical protein [Actinomadura opuntiae]|uniref:hypothetical protein n=1 Tax=Actinomadura sp. OS1-43 TaxID=604315 RepID=UPI00255B2C83|nr:hypothetical protein [Actinomadura sp. OS1-43]MDL4813156.1 hypothetical protein [Actinomadura sp. OS1-43]
MGTVDSVAEGELMGRQEWSADALEEALDAAEVALRQVTGWCEAVGQDATRRLGEQATLQPEAAHMRALAVRGRLADAVRKLQGAAEEFRQTSLPVQSPEPTGRANT